MNRDYSSLMIPDDQAYFEKGDLKGFCTLEKLTFKSDIVVLRVNVIDIPMFDQLLETRPSSIVFLSKDNKLKNDLKQLLSYSFDCLEDDAYICFSRIDKPVNKRNKYIPLADVDMMVLDKYEEYK